MPSQEERLNPHGGRVSTDSPSGRGSPNPRFTLATRRTFQDTTSSSDSTPTAVGDVEHHASLLKDFPVMMKAVVTRAELPQLSIFLWDKFSEKERDRDLKLIQSLFISVSCIFPFSDLLEKNRVNWRTCWNSEHFSSLHFQNKQKFPKILNTTQGLESSFRFHRTSASTKFSDSIPYHSGKWEALYMGDIIVWGLGSVHFTCPLKYMTISKLGPNLSLSSNLTYIANL